MGVVSSSEATICRVDEQQGDGRKEDLGPSWCHLNGSIKQPYVEIREKWSCVLGLEKSFFLSPLHHDVYSCSRASLLPFRVVNHGGLTLYSAGPLSSYDSTKDTASTALGTVAAPSARLNPPSGSWIVIQLILQPN